MRNHRVLVSLERVSVEAVAGVVGKGFFRFRQLDNVSLDVHECDMILLQGRSRRERAMLLRVLGGQAPAWTQLHGQRSATSQLVVRRGVIPRAVLPDVIAGWPGAGEDSAPGEPSTTRASVLYLLTASDQPAPAPDACQQWSRWSRQLCLGRGSVVVALETPPAVLSSLMEPARSTPAYTDDRRSPAGSVRERRQRARAPARPITPPLPCTCERPLVRIVQLGFGRIQYQRVHTVRACTRCRAPGTVRTM